jgi:hypothetical protein
MIHERGLFADEGDVGMREDALNACTELGNNLRHTLASLIECGAMDVSLRRNTPYVQTRTAYVVALEDRNLQALLGSIFSGAVTPRARTDDNEIRLTPLPLPMREGSR